MRDTRKSGWGRVTLAPSLPASRERPGRNVNPPRDVSPALMRVGGMIGFCLGGYGTVYGGGRLLGIDPAAWSSGHLPGKAVILLAASFVVALIGMVVGSGVGAAVSVRSARGN